jgi:hypothetical protein
MTVQIQTEAIELLISIFSYLIPVSVLISVSFLMVRIFKSFIRGE